MNNKILFLHPPLSLKQRYGILAQAGYTAPPYGLCYLASYARQMGYDTRILDAQALTWGMDKTMKAISDYNPDYVGITITTQLLPNAAVIADHIKNILPDVKIIVGGVHVTSKPIETMQYSKAFDFGITGEGEATLIELLEAIKSNRDISQIKGIVHRNNDSIVSTEPRPVIRDIDNLPMPAFDLLPYLPKYYRATTQTVDRLPSLLLMTARGCPGRCTFCDNSVHGHIIREHSPQYVEKMLKILTEKYAIKSIFFYDENFFVNHERVKAICSIIKNMDRTISWSCMARVDTVDREILETVYGAGCWQINFGIESADQEILNLYKKGITLPQIERSVKIASETGLSVKGFIMVGNPLETDASMTKTLEFVKRLPLDDLSIAFFTPYPGSEIYGDVENYGIFNRDYSMMSSFNPVFIPYGFTEDNMWYWAKRIYREFYLRPHIILSYIRRLKSIEQFKELFISGLMLIRYIFSSN